MKEELDKNDILIWLSKINFNVKENYGSKVVNYRIWKYR